MSNQTIIEILSGIAPDGEIALAYAKRADARTDAELSYQLLVHPQEDGSVSLLERRAVAYFVAALYGASATMGHYFDLLNEIAPELASTLRDTVSAQRGPFGKFPEGPLSKENEDGVALHLDPALREQLGPRIAAAFTHAHLLALHPRDADAAALSALHNAGWDEDGIVILSQLIAFISFQIRVVVGLKALRLAKAV